jgi:hypothetical protein
MLSSLLTGCFTLLAGKLEGSSVLVVIDDIHKLCVEALHIGYEVSVKCTAASLILACG